MLIRFLFDNFDGMFEWVSKQAVCKLTLCQGNQARCNIFTTALLQNL